MLHLLVESTIYKIDHSLKKVRFRRRLPVAGR